MSIKKIINVCEICGKTIQNGDLDHEKLCAEQREADRIRHEEIAAKYAKRLENAKVYARKDKALVLLCANGLETDARILASKKLWNIEGYFDCGTSCGIGEVISAMIEAAKNP